MSRDEPATTFWPWLGEVMASKPAVCAKTEEASAKMAAEMIE